MFPSLTMCTQLCTLRTGIIVMHSKSKLAIATVTTSSLGFEMEDDTVYRGSSHTLRVTTVYRGSSHTLRVTTVYHRGSSHILRVTTVYRGSSHILRVTNVLHCFHILPWGSFPRTYVTARSCCKRGYNIVILLYLLKLLKPLKPVRHINVS